MYTWVPFITHICPPRRTSAFSFSISISISISDLDLRREINAIIMND